MCVNDVVGESCCRCSAADENEDVSDSFSDLNLVGLEGRLAAIEEKLSLFAGWDVVDGMSPAEDAS